MSDPRALTCEVVTTRAGARAMLDHETGEVMHPVVGPLVEALQLYVMPSRLAARLLDLSRTQAPLVVLDIGLGAGSNACAAFRVSEELEGPRRPLQILSFDQTVAPFELALRDENAVSFGFDDRAREAGRFVLSRGAYDTGRTSWHLRKGPLPDALSKEAPEIADVVFWDPFSPRANPSLWNYAAFSALRRLCRSGATVHTYSGATAARSAMLLAGFAVGLGERLGETKRATTAAVNVEDLDEPLDQRWLERLRRSSAGWPKDAPTNALERVQALAQFQRP